MKGANLSGLFIEIRFVPIFEKTMDKKLTRSDNKVLGGVCAGLAEYFGFDPTLVRVIYLLLVLFGGAGILVYLILWVLMPSR